MTYSKGPWIYDAESGEIHTKDRTGFWGPDHEPVVVATVEPLDGVNNGPLLAAAYDLYIAAFELIGDIYPESLGCKFDKLRAAIAKITGESK